MKKCVKRDAKVKHYGDGERLDIVSPFLVYKVTFSGAKAENSCKHY